MNSQYEFTHNVFLDTCAFNPSDPIEQKASFQILKWAEQLVLVLILPYSVLKELDHPRTPPSVKEEALKHVFTKEVSLDGKQLKKLRAIESVIVGKGKKNKYKNDALNVFISDDSGEYFITTDKRLIKRSRQIREISDGIKICKPTELIKIVEDDRKFQIEHKKRMDKLQGKD
ncbi:hypothetical protein ACFL1E_04585 [Candidatus Omnitrophota bacterium]